MRSTYNWNISARKIVTLGPQNPYRIYVYDSGRVYVVKRYKPGNGPKYERDIVARFTVKYAVK